jgi:zinc transporter 2
MQVNYSASELSNNNSVIAAEGKKHDHGHSHPHSTDLILKENEGKNEHKHDHGGHDHHHGLGGGHAGHNHENMNIRAAFVHILGDIVQSIGVIIAAIIIFFKPEWQVADPICTIIFTVLCIFTTVPIFRDCFSVLMEATPKDIDVV